MRQVVAKRSQARRWDLVRWDQGGQAVARQGGAEAAGLSAGEGLYRQRGCRGTEGPRQWGCRVDA